ncbi:hypothetical protein TNCV_4427021 [Trichonephila clavipes]|nr:hypothetical protein TNCV_4427021 [Trichonephila clavipes]
MDTVTNSWLRVLKPLKTQRVEELMSTKFAEAQCPPIECQPNCREVSSDSEQKGDATSRNLTQNMVEWAVIQFRRRNIEVRQIECTQQFPSFR